MLPFFTHVHPSIARDLLSYRYHNLPGARRKARANGYDGAQFPWESAATGDEVTPTWVPDPNAPTGLTRIWTGDIEIHVSAMVAHAVMQLLAGDRRRRLHARSRRGDRHRVRPLLGQPGGVERGGRSVRVQ